MCEDLKLSLVPSVKSQLLQRGHDHAWKPAMEEYHYHLGIATICICSYVINTWASLQDKKENNKTFLELILETKINFFLDLEVILLLDLGRVNVNLDDPFWLFI